MRLKVIGSGSKGNAYILNTPTGNLLIECGLPFKVIQQALEFDLTSVQGCLLTHSHGDHSRATKDVMRAGINTYMTLETATSINAEGHRMELIKAGTQFRAGDFTALPFPTEHDCPGAVGYLIQYKPTGEKLLFATDTYYIRHRFQGLNYILIECNYCKETLDANIEAGLIPLNLKNRLIESHFSLENVKGFLAANDLTKVKKIVLIHLSDGNANATQMVLEIHELTKKDTVIAEAGKVIELEMCPF